MRVYPPYVTARIKEQVSLYDVASRHVKAWDKKKSNTQRQDFWAPCPFHGEKTSSFHIDARKGFYHCFGCGVHGDAITFLMELERVSYPQAIEDLARMAGIDLSQYETHQKTPFEQKKTDDAYQILKETADFYARCLYAREGQSALEYLQNKRSLTQDTIRHFHLGYAPAGRHALRTHLATKGFSVELMIEQGVVIKPDNPSDAPYDRFRDRIMFPITDSQNRIIAFGGRALSSEAMAKYLNSPETPLFHKGKTLYNLHQARKSLKKKNSHLYVCEGYMDVIALHQIGIEGAVAPLGTAMTEDQLALLWRNDSSPILCFDGDKAGQQAAARVIDRALPLLTSQKTLQFIFLPQGLDPDDVIKKQGQAAFYKLLQDRYYFVDILYAFEKQNHHPLHTPEQKAALWKSIFDKIKMIGDKDVRDQYFNHFNKIQREERGQNPYKATSFVKKAVSQSDSQFYGVKADRVIEEKLEMHLLSLVILYPDILHEIEEDFVHYDFLDPQLKKIHAFLLQEYIDFSQKNSINSNESTRLKESYLKTDTLLTKLLHAGYNTFCNFAEKNRFLFTCSPEDSVQKLAERWRKIATRQQIRIAKQDLDQAEGALAVQMTEENWEHVKQLKHAIRLLEEEDKFIQA